MKLTAASIVRAALLGLFAIAVGAITYGCFTKFEPIPCKKASDCPKIDNLTLECIDNFCRVPFDMATTPPPECTTSSTCPDERPTCVAGSCVPCESMDGGVTACSDHDSQKPFCSSGRCVQCMVAADCAALGQTCDTATHACRNCISDGECSSHFCKQSGTCAAPTDIAVVAQDDSTCKFEPHDGPEPYCQISAALSSNRTFYIVRGSTLPYQPLSIANKGTIVIQGPGRSASPTAKILAQDTGVDAVSVGLGSYVTLSVGDHMKVRKFGRVAGSGDDLLAA